MSALCHKQTSANWALQTVSFSFLGVDFLNDLMGCTLLPTSQYLRPEVGNLGSAEVYGDELARRCLGNGRSHRMLRGGGSRHPDPTAYGQTV
jgi:hypothetical protein